MQNTTAAGPSTVAPLAGNATYTSSAIHPIAYARVTGTVKSDVAGTLNIDQSPDGTNWDYSTSVAVAANTGTAFSVELMGGYARLRYVNGAAGQAAFRLYSFLRGI